MNHRLLRLVVVSAAAAAFVLPEVAHADAVTEWNATANSAIFATTPTAHAAVLSTAMVQAAVYDAVNAIAGGYRPYLPTTTPADPFFSQDAAAATAAFRVAAALVPSQLAVLQPKYDASLLAIPNGPAKTGGIGVGEASAAAILAARANDGRNPVSPFPFVFGTTPGVWRKSPPAFAADPTPWVGNVKPFLLPNAEMLRSHGPNALTSNAYAKDFNEVKSLGSLASTTRTADQTMAAIFWQAQPGGLYGGVMKSLSERFGLSTAENARLYAMTSLAAADGAIACWNDKYYWNFWRPIDAIHEAASDGNPKTTADPTWKALFDPATATTPGLTTPPFPDHPSGHSCVSSATLHAMQEFFGKDKIAFDIVSPRFPTQPRHYERFSDALQEVVDARVWGGIHFRTADEQGAEIGTEVAQWEEDHFFQPVDRHGSHGDNGHHGNTDASMQKELAQVRQATARFHRVDEARAAGYELGWVNGSGVRILTGCVASPTAGAMGYHYINAALVADNAVHLTRPEALVYESAPNGGLKLVAVEWIVRSALSNPPGVSEPPSVLGMEMHILVPPPGPAFYLMHAWIWKHNPSGMMSDWNPKVTCP